MDDLAESSDAFRVDIHAEIKLSRTASLRIIAEKMPKSSKAREDLQCTSRSTSTSLQNTLQHFAADFYLPEGTENIPPRLRLIQTAFSSPIPAIL